MARAPAPAPALPHARAGGFFNVIHETVFTGVNTDPRTGARAAARERGQAADQSRPHPPPPRFRRVAQGA
jgi:hypothetical protein